MNLQEATKLALLNESKSTDVESTIKKVANILTEADFSIEDLLLELNKNNCLNETNFKQYCEDIIEYKNN